MPRCRVAVRRLVARHLVARDSVALLLALARPIAEYVDVMVVGIVGIEGDAVDVLADIEECVGMIDVRAVGKDQNLAWKLGDQ